MKKADITDATSQHDSVAIFEYQRGTNGMRRFVRLMTSDEYARLIEAERRFRHEKVKNAVRVVFVEPVNSLSQTKRQCEGTFIAAGYADCTTYNGTTLDYEMNTPLARIKGQVNRLRSFAEFITADDAAFKEAAERREHEMKQQSRRQREHDDCLRSMSDRLRALGFAESRVQNAGWNTMRSKVEIDITTLSALIDAAEKAGA